MSVDIFYPWASRSDSWIAGRIRIYRMYRRAYKIGIVASAWRSFRNWFVWEVYDPIHYYKTRKEVKRMMRELDAEKSA